MPFLSRLSPRHSQPARVPLAAPAPRARQGGCHAFAATVLAAVKGLAQEQGAGAPATAAEVLATLEVLSGIPVPDGDALAQVQDVVARELAGMSAADRRMVASWYAARQRELAAELRRRAEQVQAEAGPEGDAGQPALRAIHAVSVPLSAIGAALAATAQSDIAGTAAPFDPAAYRHALGSFLTRIAEPSRGGGTTGLAGLLDAVVAAGGARRALSETELDAYHDAIAGTLGQFESTALEAIGQALSARDHGVLATSAGAAAGLGAVTDAYAERELAKLKTLTEARLRAHGHVRGTLEILCDAVFADTEVATRQEARAVHRSLQACGRSSAERAQGANAPRAARAAKVLRALLALPGLDAMPLPSVGAMVAKQLADMPCTSRRMLRSWLARHGREMSQALQDLAAGQPGPSSREAGRRCERPTPADAACVQLAAVQSALASLAAQDYRTSRGGFDADGYRVALRALVDRIVAPHDAAPGAAALASAVDSVVATGAVVRGPDPAMRGMRRHAIDDVLADLDPAQLQALRASFRVSQDADGRRSPALLAGFIGHDSYAAAELLALHDRVEDLAREDPRDGPLSTPHFRLYFERRAARCVPLVERLVAAGRQVAGGKGTAGLMRVQAGIEQLHAVLGHLQEPLVPAACARDFHRFHADLRLLFRHCAGTLATFDPPDMAMRLGDTVMYRCNEMLSIARRGAPRTERELWLRQREMATAVQCMVRELATARQTLQDQALVRLQRAQAVSADLDHWLGPATSPNSPAPQPFDVRAALDRLIDDLVVVSSVAGTGWKPEPLRPLRASLTALLGKGSHWLSKAQLARLARCGEIGLPMARICELAASIRDALPACVTPCAPGALAIGMRNLANSVLAMHACLARANAVGAPAAQAQSEQEIVDGVRQHAAGAVRRMLNDAVAALGRRRHIALRSRLARQDHQACRRIIRRLPPALRGVGPGAPVGGFAHRVVADGFKAAIALWAIAFDGLHEAVSGVSADTAERVHARITDAQWRTAYAVIGAAVGVRAAPAEDGVEIVALENAEFYALHGGWPRRAVMSDYALAGKPFAVCSRTATDPRTLRGKPVEVRFRGAVTASGNPETVVVSELLWMDIHRARFVADDVRLSGNSFAAEESLDVTEEAGGTSFVVSENPHLYRFLATLQSICGKGNWQYAWQFARQFHAVTALMSQALPAALTSVTMGGEVDYGWFGKGAFIKRQGDTDVEYRCGKARAGVARIDLRQDEFVSMIAPQPGPRGRPGGANRLLEREYSVARYALAVEVAGGKPTVPVGSARLGFALVEG